MPSDRSYIARLRRRLGRAKADTQAIEEEFRAAPPVKRNPHSRDLNMATLIEVRGKDVGTPGYPMVLVARWDMLHLGSATGWTLAQALRNLADVLDMEDPDAAS